MGDFLTLQTPEPSMGLLHQALRGAGNSRTGNSPGGPGHWKEQCFLRGEVAFVKQAAQTRAVSLTTTFFKDAHLVLNNYYLNHDRGPSRCERKLVFDAVDLQRSFYRSGWLKQ